MSKPRNPRNKALGKGLSALLPAKSYPASRAPADRDDSAQGVIQIPIDQIKANPLQPRTVFQPERLAELAQSIRSHGIIQPLIVRRVGGLYELVAGERRWRAARMAALERVPVIVQELADNHLLEITLIENIQREDLNPIEVAQAFERMRTDLQLSHEEIGRRTGKDRTTVTNMLRLLRLPGQVQILLAEQRLSMGHARALLALPTPELQLDLAEKSASGRFSVRQVERLVQNILEPPQAKPKQKPPQDPNTKAAAQQLELTLGTRVRIVEKSPKRGRLEIEYYSQEELQRIYELIVGEDQ